MKLPKASHLPAAIALSFRGSATDFQRIVLPVLPNAIGFENALLETMQRGTSDDGYIAARDLLVNVAVVVVLMALAQSEESGEDDDDQDEEEDGDAAEDAQAGSAAQRDGD